MQRLHVNGWLRRRLPCLAEDTSRAFHKLVAPLLDLVRMDVEILRQRDQGSGGLRGRICGHGPPPISPLTAAIATFALKAGLWFRRGRLAWSSPRSQHHAAWARKIHLRLLFRFLGPALYLFVGSEAGGKAAAIAYTLIETAKLNAVDPHAWLADTIARIPDYKISKVDDLLPWRWNG